MKQPLMVSALAIITFCFPVGLKAQETVLGFDTVVDSADSMTIRQPTGVAAASDNELGVTDALGRRFIVFRFSGIEWTVQKVVELGGVPRDVAHDGNRYLVSMREGKGLVAVEGDRFVLRPVALPSGTVPGVLAGISGGGFLVHDQAGNRVVALDAAGQVRDSWDVTGSITGLSTSRNGGFFTTVVNPGEIHRYDAAGTVVDRKAVPGQAPVPSWPSGVVEAGGDLVVVDRHGHRLAVLDSRGNTIGFGARKGWEQGLVMMPAAIALMPDGRIAVVDQMNGRIQLFRRIEDDGAP